HGRGALQGLDRFGRFAGFDRFIWFQGFRCEGRRGCRRRVRRQHEVTNWAGWGRTGGMGRKESKPSSLSCPSSPSCPGSVRSKSMAIVRWSDPFREFAQLQNRINRVFSDAYRTDEGLTTSGSWAPLVDIYQNGEHEIVLKAEVPDMTRDDIDITVDSGTLTIKGEKKLSNEVKEEHYHRIERHYASCSPCHCT